MQPDLSQMSDEELMALANGGGQQGAGTAPAAPAAPNLSQMSDEQLQQLAQGGRVQTSQDEFFNYYSDGSKALRVNISNNPQAAAKAAEMDMADSSFNNSLGALAIGAGDGLLMGGGDELLAMGDPEEQARLHAAKLYLRENYPVASTIGNIGGSIASFLPVGRLASMAAKGVGLGLKGINAANAGAGILQGTAAGALDTNEDRVAGAEMGALFSLAGEAGGAAIASRLAKRGAPGQADQAVFDNYVNPNEGGRLLSEAESTGVPLMPVDVDPGLAGLGYFAGAHSTEAKSAMRNALNARDRSQGGRLVSAIDQNFAGEADIVSLGKTIRGEGSAAADPFYKAAYAAPAPITDKPLNEILNTPAMKKALQKAKEMAENRREDWGETVGRFNRLGNFELKKGATFETLDKAKRGIDTILRKPEYRDAFGRLNVKDDEVRSIVDAQQALVTRMRELNPDYAKALDEYTPYGQRAEALDVGSKVITAANTNAKQIKSALDSLKTPEELEAFRIGAANKLIDVVKRNKRAANPWENVVTDDMQERLRVIFPEIAVDKINTLAQFEDTMRATRQDLIGGSATQGRQVLNRNLEAQTEAAPGILARTAEVGAAVATSGVSLLPQLIRTGRLKASDAAKLETVRNQEALAKDLAPILMETDPKKARKALDGILDRVDTYNRKSQKARRTGASVGAAVGTGILAQQ